MFFDCCHSVSRLYNKDHSNFKPPLPPFIINTKEVLYTLFVGTSLERSSYNSLMKQVDLYLVVVSFSENVAIVLLRSTESLEEEVTFSLSLVTNGGQMVLLRLWN
jgi:hypothetical protein